MSFGSIYGSNTEAPSSASVGGFSSIYSTSTPTAPAVSAPAPTPAPNLFGKITNAVTSFLKPPAAVAPAPSPTSYNFPGLGGAMPSNQPNNVSTFLGNNVFTGPLSTQIKSDFSNLLNTPTPKIPLTPENVLTAVYGTKPSDLLSSGNFFGDITSSYSKAINDLGKQAGTTPTERAANLGQTGLDFLNAFFSPVTSTFQHVATFGGPVGNAADIVNKVFGGGLGIVGGDAIEQMINSNPYLSPQQKTQLAPIGKQLGALAAQIAVGKAGSDVIGEMKSKTSDFLSKTFEDTRLQQLNSNPALIDSINKQLAPPVKVPVASETPSEATPVPISTPATKFAEYNKSQGYEPITPDNQLPTIDYGKGAKPTEPVIQTEVPNELPAPAGMKVVPLKEEGYTPLHETADRTNQYQGQDQGPNNGGGNGGASEVPQNQVESGSAATIDRPVLPDGTRVTKAANDINQHLVEQGIKELTPEEQAKYTSGSYKDSKAQADILARENRGDLNKMATSGEGIPSGVHPQVLFNVVRDLAKAEKDYPLLQQLANSPLATERSEAAGKLGSAGYGQERGANAEIDALRRAAKVKSGGEKGAKAVATEAKRAKATISKTAARLIDYNKILDAITC